MALVKFVGFKKPVIDELKLGKLKEDGAEKLVGVAELDRLPAPEGAELIEAFAGKLNEMFEEPEALLERLLPTLEVVVARIKLPEDVAEAVTELLSSPRYGGRFGQSKRPQTELPLVSLCESSGLRFDPFLHQDGAWN